MFCRYALFSVLILAFLSLATHTKAQDQIGVYWDEAFTQNTTTSLANHTIEGYVVIKDPTVGGGIIGWKCHVFNVGSVITSWSLAGGGVNSLYPGLFDVTMSTPLPPAADIVVASFQLAVTRPADIKIRSLIDTPPEEGLGYLAADQPGLFVPLTTTTGESIVAHVDVPVPDIDPTYIALGIVPIGEIRDEVVRVGNAPGGTGILELDIGLGCGDPQWSLTGLTGPVSLAPGDYVDVPVRFTATVSGPTTCHVTFGDDLPTVELNAVARLWSWDIVGPEHMVMDVGYPGFGAIMVTNTGEMNLGLYPYVRQMTLPPYTEFHYLSGGGQTVLPPGETHTIEFSLLCWISGEYEIPMRLDSYFNITVPATATALGDPPLAEVSPDTLDFGFVSGSMDYTLPLNVANVGTSAFLIDPRIVNDRWGVLSVTGGGGVLPGESRTLYVTYSDYFGVPGYATLELGPGLPDVVLHGMREDDYRRNSFLFVAGGIGESVHRTVWVGGCDNPFGCDPLSVSLADSTHFSAYSYADPLYEILDVGARFNPAVMGTVTDTLTIHEVGYFPPHDLALPLYGCVAPDPAELGIYFDTAFTSTDTVVAVGSIVPAYLVLHNPYIPGGISSWQFRLALAGEGRINSVSLSGDATNRGWGDEYIVSYPDTTPLPTVPEGILLGVFEIEVLGGAAISLEIHPCDLADGELSWSSSVEPILRLPLATTTGTVNVATIHPTSATPAPSPPARTELLPNAPNPFNPQTVIRYRVSEAGPVNVTIYDVRGRRVRTLVRENQGPGEKELVWRGDDDGGRQLASGAYYVRMEAGGRTEHRKVMLLK